MENVDQNNSTLSEKANQEYAQKQNPQSLNTLYFTQKKKKVVLILILLFLFVGIVFVFKTIKNEQEKKKTPPVLEKIQPTPTDSLHALQKGPWKCPVSAFLCKENASYKEKAMFVKFSKKTPLYAVFDGKVEFLSGTHPIDEKNTEKFNLVTLTDENRGLRAFYFFKGETGESRQVKEGEIIAVSSGEPIRYRDNSSFVLEIENLASNGMLIALSEKDFIQ